MAQVVCKINQSLFDLCLQAYGSLAFMGQILKDNPSLSYDSQMSIGDVVIFDDSIGVKRINQKRDTENISFNNGPAVFGYVLGSQDGDLILTQDGDFIQIEI